MPKSKKNKTRDFQKVKLKVGKKLPKGDNVTNLSFKTKQIQLTQRIKDDEGQDIVTRKKLSVQDLLRQCDHHSSSARVSAISGLKELWLNNSADLMVPGSLHGYGEILLKLSTLFLDNEAVVRHLAINMFKLMLSKLSKPSEVRNSKNSLDGRLFSHIHAYLCCAMNHVHEDIKLDALVLFDTLLDFFPHLVVQQTGDLLKNLIGYIASPAYLGAKADSTTQRLSLNPDSKLPAMKFRAQVLIRMKRAFSEAINEQERFAEELDKSMMSKEATDWSLYKDHDGPDSKQNTYLLTDPRSGGSRFKMLFQGGCHELDEYITKPSSLESFLNLSVPVLMQCWKEAYAGVTNLDSDGLVSADSIEVMSLVVSIIQLMFVLCASHPGKHSATLSSTLNLVSPEVLVKHYQQDFEKLLLNGFPYSVQVHTPLIKKRKKNKTYNPVDSVNSQSSLMALNLEICDIMSSFCVHKALKPNFDYLKKMETYVARILQKGSSIEQSKILGRILKNLFSNPQTIDSFTGAYSSAVKFYLSCSVKAPQKLMFYILFAFMVKTWDGWERNYLRCELYKHNSDVSESLEEFLQNLPELLQDVVSLESGKEWTKDILTLMAHGNVQNNSQTFPISFKAKLHCILDSEKGVLSTGDEDVQKRLLSLIPLGTPLNQDHLKQLLFLIRRPVEQPLLHRRKSCSMVSYVIHSMISCMRWNLPLTNQIEFNKMTPDQTNQLSDYLKFMFSLLIGMTGEELDAMSPKITNEGCERWFGVEFTLQGDQWDRHREIAMLVSRELTSFSIPAVPSKGYHQRFTYLDNIEQFWMQVFKNRSRIHILSAFSLLQFFCHASLLQLERKPGPELYNLASCIVASVLISVHSPSSSNPSPSEEVVKQIKSDVIQCLTVDASLLELVMGHLAIKSKDALSVAEREASQAAKFSLSLDENIKQKL